MNTELPRPTASNNRCRPGLHTSILAAYHSLGVYVHQTGAQNTTSERQSPPWKTDRHSVLSLTSCGDVRLCLRATAALLWPLAVPRMTDERLCSSGRMTSTRREGNYSGKTCPMPLRPLQIPHRYELPWEGARGSAMTGQRLIARVMAQDYLSQISGHNLPHWPKHVAEINDLFPRAAVFNSS
jgi:hypothetical protein